MIWNGMDWIGDMSSHSRFKSERATGLKRNSASKKHEEETRILDHREISIVSALSIDHHLCERKLMEVGVSLKCNQMIGHVSPAIRAIIEKPQH